FARPSRSAFPRRVDCRDGFGRRSAAPTTMSAEPTSSIAHSPTRRLAGTAAWLVWLDTTLSTPAGRAVEATADADGAPSPGRSGTSTAAMATIRINNTIALPACLTTHLIADQGFNRHAISDSLALHS